MDIYSNHKRLYVLAASFFIVLTLFVAVLPALNNQANNAPLPGSKPFSKLEEEGKGIFIAEGCVACHTQQVRNLEMDNVWGARPSIAADYARNTRVDIWRNTATLMGSERTGPDLTNIGMRQSSTDWHLMHLYNPRSVVPASIMPSYSWLFVARDYAYPDDIIVNVPEEFRKGISGKIVASHEALALVAYLKSLKQTPLPTGRTVPIFLYGKGTGPVSGGSDIGKNIKKPGLDGAVLYAANCQACHQENGLGLAGAFPPLKGSKVVLDSNPEVQVTIIMKGYSGRVSEGFGIMPPVGTNNSLTTEAVAAIINHERSSWGNDSKKITPDEVKKIVAAFKK